MKRTAIVFSIVLVAAVLLLTAAVALGQVLPRRTAPTGALTTPRSRITAPIGTSPTPRQQQRAQIITERIETIIARFNNNEDRHIAAFQAVKAKVTEIVSTLSAKGYDTSKLSADLTAWDQMIVKAGQDYVAFIAALKNAEQYAPYTSQGQFLSAIQQARALLVVYRQDALDVRHQYQTVIRPDVQALAAQTPVAPSSTPTSTP
jgi:hypothetical protein